MKHIFLFLLLTFPVSFFAQKALTTNNAQVTIGLNYEPQEERIDGTNDLILGAIFMAVAQGHLVGSHFAKDGDIKDYLQIASATYTAASTYCFIRGAITISGKRNKKIIE